MPAHNPRTNTTAAIATKYVVFAAVATGCNLGTQALLDHFYRGPLALYVSLAVGTLTGLAVKYVLDKNLIFYDSTRGLAHTGRQFGRYALTGVLTTAVFWGMELGFYAAFGTRIGRYSGGTLGLALGYWLKYQLDRRLVFSAAAGHWAQLESHSVSGETSHDE